MACEDIRNKFKEIEGWEKVSDGRDAYTKLFKFSDFKQAFSFMTSIAMKAEQMNHHPEWFNVYNRITVDLTTHDAGGITNNDVNLARILNSLV